MAACAHLENTAADDFRWQHTGIPGKNEGLGFTLRLHRGSSDWPSAGCIFDAVGGHGQEHAGLKLHELSTVIQPHLC